MMDKGFSKINDKKHTTNPKKSHKKTKNKCLHPKKKNHKHYLDISLSNLTSK